MVEFHLEFVVLLQDLTTSTCKHTYSIKVGGAAHSITIDYNLLTNKIHAGSTINRVPVPGRLGRPVGPSLVVLACQNNVPAGGGETVR